MNPEDLVVRLDELLAARDVAKQSGDQDMFQSVQSGIAQVADQMKQSGIEDPEAAFLDYKVKQKEQEIQDQRVQSAAEQGNALGQKQGIEQGYQHGYDAGNPVGALAKKLAAELFGGNPQPQQQPQQPQQVQQ